MGTLINAEEAAFFDGIASEIPKLAGDEVKLYALKRKDGDYDPLYGEPKGDDGWNWDGPFLLNASWVKPNYDRNAESEGEYKTSDDGELWFARVDFEEYPNGAIPYVKENDMVELYGKLFDIARVTADGSVGNSAVKTLLKCELKRSTRYLPERKITNLPSEDEVL